MHDHPPLSLGPIYFETSGYFTSTRHGFETLPRVETLKLEIAQFLAFSLKTLLAWKPRDRSWRLGVVHTRSNKAAVQLHASGETLSAGCNCHTF